MAEKLTNYQCPSCTGPLRFDEATGKLQCDYCGSSFSVQEIEALYAEKNETAAQAREAQEASQPQEPLGEPGEEWGDDARKLRAYNCPSCGAELICDETTAATSCPYCGNPTVVPGQLSGSRKPDVIIPFQYSKEQAIQALKNHYKGKPLLPKAFTAENHIQEIKGVYVPFWLFDTKAEGDMTFNATRSHVITTQNEIITETDHFLIRRRGSMKFESLPVDASSKMPDACMDAIEPFRFDALKEFSMAYLPGFLADKYDVSTEDSQSRVQERCKTSAVNALSGTVQGYETCVPVQTNVSVRPQKVRYALLPVWLLSTQWAGKNFLFAMNGQTGRLIGDLPIDKKKLFAICGGVFTAVTALCWLLL